MTRRTSRSLVRAAVFGIFMTAASMTLPLAASAEPAAPSSTHNPAATTTQDVAERTIRHFVIAAMQIERLTAKARQVDAEVPQKVLNAQARRIIEATPHVDVQSYRALQRAVRQNARVRARVQAMADQLKAERQSQRGSPTGNRI